MSQFYQDRSQQRDRAGCSTSSDSDENYVTPLTELRERELKKKLKEAKKKRKEKKSKKKHKKRERSDSNDSESESEASNEEEKRRKNTSVRRERRALNTRNIKSTKRIVRPRVMRIAIKNKSWS